MHIESLHTIHTGTQPEQNIDPKTDEACRQFEGLLLGMILRTTLASPETDENKAAGAGIMKEYAAEQLAQSISDNGGIGIADMMREQLNYTGKNRI